MNDYIVYEDDTPHDLLDRVRSAENVLGQLEEIAKYPTPHLKEQALAFTRLKIAEFNKITASLGEPPEHIRDECYKALNRLSDIEISIAKYLSQDNIN